MSSTPGAVDRRRLRRRAAPVAMLAAAAVLLAWSGYKAAVARPADAMMPVAIGCGPGPVGAADLSAVVEDGPIVECEPWDVGTGVAGYSWTAPQPRGVVLFQHGWGDYTQRWVTGADDFIPALLAAGFSVHGFDMWGNGRSAGVRGAVDVPASVRDHQAARALLGEQELPVYVAGHSLGGLVTAASVVEDESGLAGMILLAPAVKYDTTALIRAVTAVGGFVAPTLAAPSTGDDADLVGVDALTSLPTAAAELSSDPLLHEGRVPWITADGGARISHRNWERYEQITIPVLALHGDEDQSTDPSGSAELVAAVSSEDATFVSLPGVRHAILDDVRADESRQVVLDWLDEHTPR